MEARILRVALQLFAERGFHGTSIPLVLEAAHVGASALYRRFESKEALVNAVFRDAKGRLGDALREGLDPTREPRALFADLWARLVGFARAEPEAFHFLELQDHAAYLDPQSRLLEMSVLAPIYLALLDFQRRGAMRGDVPAHLVMASVWGAFVGLMKAERNGYLRLTDESLAVARDACWRAFAIDEAKSHEPERSRPVKTRPQRTRRS
ncbi:MAG: TetR/AcrR family transcriptional regulator [Sandaracinaceae bacterium]|nr:TetR/AcrR family transcriptional regulator [Sandaracinaceae bacterium]